MSCHPADVAVCAVTARHIAEGAADPRKLDVDLHRCLKTAEALADQTHQAMGVGA
ncbi:hypothetical protein [Paracoccus sp. IB05]|uniref:hypothetical protein n=1 Tax=Paracoccus sp. IB05 TaxID=2779367 RepID=UPI0018E792D3|nr:hypothetical protein [Paracoccus sp. IB05]MBJ2153869.1 hypothetical protein [Paracoccus sp. IB05]